MTQAVLKNEITELKPESTVDPEMRRVVANGVANVLSDSYRLYINTQGMHWNVEGPLFFSLHQLTENQYRELAESIDDLAERIRALGMPAPQSIQEFTERSILQDLPTDGNLQERIERLVSDYEHAAARGAHVIKLAEKCGDYKTADLLTDRVGTYEQNAWMLRATIAS